MDAERRQRAEAEAHARRMEEQMSQQQQQLVQMQKMMEWMTQRMSAYDAHLAVSSSS